MDLSTSQFKKFQEFIYSKSGIRIPDTKIALLSNRIRRRLKECGLPDFQSYYDFVTSPGGRDELSGFLDAVTTNETSFFRTEKHFEWFQTDFISELIQRERRGEHPKSVRVWSAACSTGEEPYTLAICLVKNQLRLKGWKLEIVGTDISEQALQTAQAGVYRQRSLEQFSDTQRQRYFTKQRDSEHWEVRPTLRDLVTFRNHNLMQPLRVPPFDCVFIRNVLIYFDRDSKRQVIGNLVPAMSKGGYLVTGPSEGIFDMLDMLTKQSPFLYQK